MSGPGRGAPALPLLLSVVAGLTDVTTFVLLDGMFSAHITGNLVVLAADVATERPVHPTTLLAVPFFVVVAAAVTALVTRSTRPPARWVFGLATAQLVFLLAAGTLSVALGASRHPDGAAALGVGLLAVAGMAVQNSLLHLAYRSTPSTAVMTGNVVEATMSGVRILMGRSTGAADDRAVWRRTWPLIVGFLAGCLFGALACRTLHDLGWVLPVLAALVVVVHTRTRADEIPSPGAQAAVTRR